MKTSDKCDDPFGLRGSSNIKDNTKYAVYLPKKAKLVSRAILFEEERMKSESLSWGEKTLINQGGTFDTTLSYDIFELEG